MRLEIKCERCGEVLSANQQTCVVCGTQRRDNSIYSGGIGNGFDDNIGVSGVFLLPTREDGDALRSIRPKTNRLAVWIAIGLGAMSTLGGILYYLHYHQVGNRVTEILPRDTVAYIVMGQPLALEESVLSLNRWENSRPIRRRLTEQQQAFVRAQLLDMGLSTGALFDLKEGAREVHIAIIAEPSRSPALSPYDTLVFLGFDDGEVRDHLVGRVQPFFDHVGSEGGVDIAVRRSGSHIIALATFDEYVVLCLGGDATLRRVLRNRKRGPNHSLNDDEGFRTAYRDRKRNASLWSYVRYDHALHFGLSQWVYPHLTEHQQRELNVHRHLFSADALRGISINSQIEHGEEHTVVRLYPTPDSDLSTAAEQMGQGERRTLQAIPTDATAVISLTVNQPQALLERWSAPIARAMNDMQLLQLTDELEAFSQRLSSVSSIDVGRDIWANFESEATVAWIPALGDAEPQPLFVLRVRDAAKADNTTATLAEHVLRPLPFFTGASPTVVKTPDGGFIRIGPNTASEGIPQPINNAMVLFCWRTAANFWIASPRCGVVDRSVETIKNQNGLNNHPQIQAALAGDRALSTALIAINPSALTGWLDPSQQSFVRDDFLATASIHTTRETVSIFSNVSPISLAAHQAIQGPSAGAYSTVASHSDPCTQLVRAVCDSLDDPSHCPEWKQKVRGTPATACETGLRTLNALQKHPL